MLIDLSETGPKTPKQNCSCLNFTCKTNIHTFSVLSILWKKTKTFWYSIHCIYLFGLFIFLLIVLCTLDVISHCVILGSFSIYHSDQSSPLIRLFWRSFCVLYILWYIKWFVDATLIENVQPSKFHNRQNKVLVKKRSSLYYLSFAAKLLRLQEGYWWKWELQ